MSLDGVAEMANATETQAGGLDPDLSQNGYGLGVSSHCSPQEHAVSLRRDIRCAQPLLQRATVVAPSLLRMASVPFRERGFVEVLFRITIPL